MPGFKVMLIGPGGTGKTFATRTLLDTGITPFVLFTEQGASTLGDVPEEKIRRHYIRPVTLNWQALQAGARAVNINSYEGLTKMAPPDKAANQQFIQLIGWLGSPVTEGEVKWQPVDFWRTDRALVIDGLSGVCRMSVRNTVGTKLTMAPPEYGVAQNQVEQLLLMLANVECHVILIAHVEREVDQITGGTVVMASAIGKALAPKLPPLFDEVIYAKWENGSYLWSTNQYGVDTKARLMPRNAAMQPDYKPLVKAWLEKGGRVEETK